MFEFKIFIPIEILFPISERKIYQNCITKIKHIDERYLIHGGTYDRDDKSDPYLYFDYLISDEHEKREIFISPVYDLKNIEIGHKDTFQQDYSEYPVPLLSAIDVGKWTILNIEKSQFGDKDKKFMYEVKTSLLALVENFDDLWKELELIPNNSFFDLVVFKQTNISIVRSLLHWLKPISEKYSNSFAVVSWLSKDDITRQIGSYSLGSPTLQRYFFVHKELKPYLAGEIDLDTLKKGCFTRFLLEYPKNQKELNLLEQKHREWIAYVNERNNKIK